MSGVGDGLGTVELPGSSDVVIEHPVLAPQTLRISGVLTSSAQSQLSYEQ